MPELHLLRSTILSKKTLQLHTFTMDNSRPHLTPNSDNIDGKKKKRERVVIENGVVYEIIPDADEEWPEDEDEGELEADYYSTGSKADLDARDGIKVERLKLHDARMDEPRTTEFTMTKFDNLTKSMDELRALWDEDAAKKPPSPSSPTPIIDKKTQNSKKKKAPTFGTPIHDYETYHATTIALLKTDKEVLDNLYRSFKAKRRELGKTISEKSSMVNLKAGNTLGRMMVEMITPGPEEIGEEAYREAVEERRIKREREEGWDGEIEGAGGGVCWG